MSDQQLKPGVYLVPTPIGNLKDITLRGLDVLKAADRIAAEDTRHSAPLLKHYGVTAHMVSLHAHNEHGRVAQLLDDVRQNGWILAVISDAGTPGLSDPGFLIARAAIQAGLHVEVLPGATAAIPALMASGLPADRFCFEGFLPMKKGRQTRLTALREEKRTMVFYESPHKLLRTLQDLADVLGPERPAAIARELTKLHEEVRRGSLAELHQWYSTKGTVKGEFVLVVGGADSQAITAEANEEEAD